ncbi:hypothetical protein HG531_008612 [Fusarium graminearum]|nr:hypothetical protein HG531_008612 [Fusarium graminearum]
MRWQLTFDKRQSFGNEDYIGRVHLVILDLSSAIRRLELIPLLDQHASLARRLKVYLPANTSLVSAIRSLPGDGILDVEGELLLRASRAENELQARRVREVQRKIANCALRGKASAAERLGVEVAVVDGLRWA